MEQKPEKSAWGGQSTSARILSAAFRCIARRGYADVSLRDIASEAGVVLSQLNYYYSSREGLFSAVLSAMTQSIRAEAAQGLGTGTTPREHLNGLVARFQQILSRRPEYSALLLDLASMAQWKTPFRRQLRELYSDLYAMTENRLTQPGGPPARVPSRLTSRVVVNTLVGELMQAALDPESHREIGTSLRRLCLNL